MKIKHKELIIWPSVLILILVISWVMFRDERTKEKTIANTNTNNNQSVIAPVENNNSNSAVANINANTNNIQLTTYNYSLPILMYHHIRDFNDPSDQIGTNLSVSPADFTKELDLIKERGYTTINFHDIESGNVPDKAIILTFDDGYENFYQNAYPELIKRGMKAVSYIIVNDIGGGDYMTESQIAEISNNGIEIGSHTLSHPDLAISSDTKARKEIFDSKTSLEKMTGKKVISLCYPSGKYTATTEALTKEAGYNFAVTTNGGITTFGDLYALNRHRVNNDTSIGSWIK